MSQTREEDAIVNPAGRAELVRLLQRLVTVMSASGFSLGFVAAAEFEGGSGDLDALQDLRGE